MKTQLNLLGTADLRSSDGIQLQSVLQQPRRFLLLAHLAIATRSGFVRRDAVIGIFWPDAPQDKARGSLNQAIHQLRRSLGVHAILSRGTDEIALNHEVIACDAVAFLEAIEQSRWQDAMTVYRGDLLPGFFAPGTASELDHWLGQERERFRKLATTAAWQLAEEASAQGDIASSIVWARRACDWSEGDEEAIRKLMRHLDRLGDRAGVIQAYESLVRELEKAETTPAPETVRLFQDLRESWHDTSNSETDTPASYEIGENSSTNMPPSPLTKSADAEGRITGRKRRAQSKALRIQSIATTTLLTVAFLTLWGLKTNPMKEQPEANSFALVVPPVEDYTESSLPAGALTAEIIRKLREAPLINVVAATESNDTPQPAAPKTFYLRTGVVRSNDRYRLIAHLIDARTNTTLSSMRTETMANDTLNIVDGFALQAANFARKEVGRAITDQNLRETEISARAIALVQMGREDRSRADSLRVARVHEAARVAYEKADSIFREAEEMTPRWILPTLERARTAYKRMWLEMHAPKKTNETSAIRWAQEGIAHVERILVHNPHDLDVIELRAVLTYWSWRLSQPDPASSTSHLLDQAEKDAQHVTKIDPMRSTAWRVLASTMHARGDHETALWALKRAMASDVFLRNDLEIWLRIFTEAAEVGDYATADHWCRIIESQYQDSWFSFHCRLMLLTLADEPPVTDEIERIRTRAENKKLNPVRAAHIDALAAAAYARAGDHRRAQALLDHVAQYRAQDPELQQLEAWGWLLAGDSLKARSLLQDYIHGSPIERQGLVRIKRFEALGPFEETAARKFTKAHET